MLPDNAIVNTGLFNIVKVATVVAACKAMNVARSVFYYRKNRFNEYGLAGLGPRSRKPHRLANELSADKQQAIIELHKQKPHYSPARISHELRVKQGITVSEKTTREHIKKYDAAQSHPEKKRYKRKKGERRKKKYKKLEEVQIDHKGWFWLNKKKVYPMGAIDCFSRMREIEFHENMKSSSVIEFMERFIEKNGKMKRIRSDNAKSFTSAEFKQWCKSKRIRLVHSPVGCPWKNAFIESCFATLEREFLSFTWFDDWEDAKQKLAEDNKDYNEQRYHNSIKCMPLEKFLFC